MSLWLRMGPLGLSSRGRVGVRMGPVSWYGGGSRRRRRSSSGGGGFLAILLVLALIGAAIKYWYVALPLAVVLAWLLGWSSKRRQRLAEEQRQAWLAAPPPPLQFPGRFTHNWFAQHGPHLHPGHMALLVRELRRRGWSDVDIAERAAPHLPWPLTGEVAASETGGSRSN